MPPSTTQSHVHRDFFGSFVGILVFLGGIALLLEVFKLAYEMFSVPAGTAIGVHSGQKLDLTTAGTSVTSIILRILLLMIMGLLGSWIANRGISMYTHSRGIRIKVEEP